MTSDLCDVNVLVALAIERHGHHRAASAWLGDVHIPGGIVICRATQQGFLRLLTTASVVAPYDFRPMSNDEAWARSETLLADDRLTVRAEPDGLDSLWRGFAARRSASPKLWMDAYLAAFAKAGGCRMVTTDGAFRQFTGLDLLVLGDGGPV